MVEVVVLVGVDASESLRVEVRQVLLLGVEVRPRQLDRIAVRIAVVEARAGAVVHAAIGRDPDCREALVAIEHRAQRGVAELDVVEPRRLVLPVAEIRPIEDGEDLRVRVVRVEAPEREPLVQEIGIDAQHGLVPVVQRSKARRPEDDLAEPHGGKVAGGIERVPGKHRGHVHLLGARPCQDGRNSWSRISVMNRSRDTG